MTVRSNEYRPWPRRRRAGLWRLWLAACLALAPVAASAAPQGDDEELDDFDMEGEEDDDEGMEFAPVRATPSGEVPKGATETPAPPEAVGMESAKEAEEALAPERTGYPVELALRPLLLDPGMLEVGAEAPMYPSPAGLTSVLRARYGVVERVDLGLRYAVVGADEVDAVLGKSVGLEVQVGITDWVAAQLTLPLMIDPFAMGITLGAPFRFAFGDAFAIFFGRDLVSFRVVDFVPSLADPRVDAARIAALDSGTIVSRGSLQLLGGAHYQLAPNMALTADFGVVAEDYGREKTGVPLGGTFTFTTAGAVDLAARLGFDDIGDGGSFSLRAAVAVRL